MSGAEFIAVLGIISSVIAIVDATKQVYDTSSSATGLPEAFRDVAGRLPLVMEVLTSVEQQVRNGKVGATSCEAMKPLINQCKEKVIKLDGIFQKVIPSDEASRSERYFRAVRALGKGGRVETLMTGVMNDVLLVASKYGVETATADQVDRLNQAIKDISIIEPSIPDSELEATTFTNNNFGSAPMTNNNVLGDQKFQAIYGTGKGFQAESQTFHMENEHVRNAFFHAQVQQFSLPSETQHPGVLGRNCEIDILHQLEFSGMGERYDDIVEAQRHTFTWIYEKPELGFVDWLRNGRGIYWISGKAGSGKSTLMKCLFEDPRTYQNLPKDISDTVVSGFFFHDRGDNQLLKSQEGLFRALIHTILFKYRQLIPVALPKRWDATMKATSSERDHAELSRWSLNELRTAFEAITYQTCLRLHICLLIDGLDEFSGRHRDIIDTLAGLLPTQDDSCTRIQLCVSSRPLIIFEESFLGYQQLKVQDLTVNDIKLYVTTNFEKVPTLKDLSINDPTTTEQIVDEILQKAEGVFLWVSLVVDSLVESLQNGDDMQTLSRRLSALPAGLEPLYRSMIGKIDDFYRKDAADIFCVVQCAVRALSPLALSYLSDDPRNGLLGETSILDDEEIAKRHSNVAKRLKSRTAGLIEISPIKRAARRGYSHRPTTPSTSSSAQNLDRTLWVPSRVQYLHLTVKEFFRSHGVPTWSAIPMFGITADPHLAIVACCLRQFRATGSLDLYDHKNTTPWPPHPSMHDYCVAAHEGIIATVMFHARESERLNKTSNLVYLKALDDEIMAKQLNALGDQPTAVRSSTKSSKPKLTHWSQSRYGDWNEPEEWSTDFLAYLIVIGMSYSVIDFLHQGYRNPAGPRRPLLLFATCDVAPSYAVSDSEKDTVDPIIVEELFKRGCHPNQSFKSSPAYDIGDWGERTIWESVLFNISQRFPPDGDSAARYFTVVDAEGMHDLRVRWLNVIKLFLDYGANPNQLVYGYKHLGRGYASERGIKSKTSGFLILNRAFSDFDHPLVQRIRRFMEAHGAIELEEHFTQIGKPYRMRSRYRNFKDFLKDGRAAVKTLAFKLPKKV